MEKNENRAHWVAEIAARVLPVMAANENLTMRGSVLAAFEVAEEFVYEAELLMEAAIARDKKGADGSQ